MLSSTSRLPPQIPNPHLLHGRNKQAHAGVRPNAHDNHAPVAGARHAVLLILHYAQPLRDSSKLVQVAVPVAASISRRKQEHRCSCRCEREKTIEAAYVMRASAFVRLSASSTLCTSLAERTLAKKPASYASFLHAARQTIPLRAAPRAQRSRPPRHLR